MQGSMRGAPGSECPAGDSATAVPTETARGARRMTSLLTITKPRVPDGLGRAARPLACAMQRGPASHIARCARAVALSMVLAAPVRAAQPGPFGSALRWPLAGETRELRGGFGEPREGHFHGGLDLSTGRQVGAEVLAPQSGWVERVHASGVGYGRSLYIRTTDGRLIVFGHLDAYEPALAAYVDSVQCATGDYEQDLW